MSKAARRPTTATPTPPAPPPRDNLGTIIAGTVVGGLFGSGAPKLGLLIACGRSKCANPLYGVQASTLAMAIGFVVVVTGASIIARRTGDSSKGVVTAAIGALAGGFVSILTGANDLPLTAVLQPLFFFSVCVVLFGFPAAVWPPASLDRLHGAKLDELAKLYGLLALAALSAGSVTGLLQLSAHLVPAIPVPDVVAYRPDNPGFFLSNPVGTGLLMAPWIVLTWHPLLWPRQWQKVGQPARLWWMVGLCVAALVLAGFYAIAFFAAGNGRWIERAGLDPVTVALLFIALLLPPLAAMPLLLRGRSAADHRGAWLAFGGIVAVIGGPIVAVVLSTTTNQPFGDAIYFALIHALSSLAAIGGALAARRYLP